jgi:L-threonylcarbamoyladenylate synthase
VIAAAGALAAGDLVILPTDTVYGLAADIAHDRAVARIPVAKGRSADMPLQLLFGLDAGMVARYAAVTPLAGRWLAAQGAGGWTLILPAKPGWDSPALAGGSTVAVRVPANAIVRGVVATLGRPVAATSANRHGEPSPVTCEQAVRSVGDSAALAIDDGPARYGVDSTIIDLSVTPPRLLRLGAVTREEVARTLGLPTIGGG